MKKTFIAHVIKGNKESIAIGNPTKEMQDCIVDDVLTGEAQLVALGVTVAGGKEVSYVSFDQDEKGKVSDQKVHFQKKEKG